MSNYANIFEEIKIKASLEDEIEKTGSRLIRSGSGRMKCCCPLHDESTPSFMLYKGDEYDTFYCWGCRNGGSVIEFIKFLKNFSTNKEIVEYFAKNYNLEYSDKEKDLDEIFSEEFERRKIRNRVIYNYGVSTSKIIQSYIRTREDPVLEFKRIQSYLRALDFSIYENNMDQLKFHRETVIDYIRKSEQNDNRKSS
jgi:DNA primase